MKDEHWVVSQNFCFAGDCNWVQKNSSKGQSWCKADFYNVIDLKALGVLTWEYAALKAAVLVLFKNNFVTFSFTGLTCNIRQVCKRLTPETREVEICVFEIWNETFSTNQSSPRSLRPHPLPGGSQPQWWSLSKHLELIFLQLYLVFIGPRSDHSLPMSVTHWLTN